MSASEKTFPVTRNALYSLAAAGAVLLGLFLLAGAGGHIVAVWPSLDAAANPTPGNPVTLLLPGGVLATTGVLNLGLSAPLWKGNRRALNWALACNIVAAAYCGWLLLRGVPDHPIGLFLAVTSSEVLLLSAVRAGLVWPAASTR